MNAVTTSAPATPTRKGGDATAPNARSASPFGKYAPPVAVIAAALLGVLAIVAFSTTGNHPLAMLAMGLALACASLLVGGLIGFLFGIPRRRPRKTAVQTGKEGRSDDGEEFDFEQNTNLEQISDWLIKILVGVGLTQLTGLGHGLLVIGDVGAQGFGYAQGSGPFSIAISLYFATSGFFAGYILTSLHLGGAILRAERKDKEKLQQQVQELTEAEKQTRLDNEALKAMNSQLLSRSSSVNQEALNKAIQQASVEAREMILYRARLQRDENWEDRRSKPVMERTIPIFRALYLSDVDRESHAIRGQLAFALKDKIIPEWGEAKKMLDEAIEVRDLSRDDSNLGMYEYFRAICSIEHAAGQLSDETNRCIEADLVASFRQTRLFNWAKQDQAIKRWSEDTKTSLDKLKGEAALKKI